MNDYKLRARKAAKTIDAGVVYLWYADGKTEAEMAKLVGLSTDHFRKRVRESQTLSDARSRGKADRKDKNEHPFDDATGVYA